MDKHETNFNDIDSNNDNGPGVLNGEQDELLQDNAFVEWLENNIDFSDTTVEMDQSLEGGATFTAEDTKNMMMDQSSFTQQLDDNIPDGTGMVEMSGNSYEAQGERNMSMNNLPSQNSVLMEVETARRNSGTKRGRCLTVDESSSEEPKQKCKRDKRLLHEVKILTDMVYRLKNRVNLDVLEHKEQLAQAHPEIWEKLSQVYLVIDPLMSTFKEIKEDIKKIIGMWKRREVSDDNVKNLLEEVEGRIDKTTETCLELKSKVEELESFSDNKVPSVNVLMNEFNSKFLVPSNRETAVVQAEGSLQSVCEV